jgi:hypothetical protein
MLLHDVGGMLQRQVGIDRDHRAPHEVTDLYGKASWMHPIDWLP